MVNRYNQYKVVSLKAKRYTLQSSSPKQPSKEGSIITITSPKHSCLQEIIHFCHWVVCAYNSSTDTNAFFLSYLITCDYMGHVEGFCLGTDISITSANCNCQNYKPRCIYQVFKFPK